MNLYVQLGHGRDYAWSATTATSDNVDTFAEVLCQDDFHYLYKGQCLAMEKLERANTLDARTRVDDTPPGSRDADRLPDRPRHRLRARHGEGQEGRVRARAHHLLPRGRLGDRLPRAERPGAACTDPESFQRAAANINFAFNWGYVDADHIAYQRRAGTRSARRAPRRTSRSSAPASTTGRASTRDRTRRRAPLRRAPARDRPDYLVSWNNKQAPGWAAADDKYAYGSLPPADDRRAASSAAIKGGAR